MKDLAVTKFKHNIGHYMDQVHFNHERYCLTNNGDSRAVIMSKKEYEEIIEYIGLRDEMRSVK